MIIRVPESAGTLYERIQYPAGELQVRLTASAISTLYGTPKVSVLCRGAHMHLMELALLSDALHNLRPNRALDSTLILPYLPYGRADRRFVEGDCHGLHTFGAIIDGMHYNRVRTLDAHSFRAQGNIANLVDVSPRPFLIKAFADMNLYDARILLPDEGSKTRYDLGKDFRTTQCRKKRDPATGKLSGFEVPPFEESKALIIDDICDGGGTFIGLAKAINEPSLRNPIGATKKLYLYVTHGVFSQGMEPLLKHFEKIYTTDSLKRTLWMWNKWIYWTPPNLEERVKVFDCEPALLEEAK